jgi:hypothetical protein
MGIVAVGIDAVLAGVVGDHIEVRQEGVGERCQAKGVRAIRAVARQRFNHENGLGGKRLITLQKIAVSA